MPPRPTSDTALWAFGFGDVTERPCATAAIVATVLDVEPTPCGAACDVVRFAEKLRAA